MNSVMRRWSAVTALGVAVILPACAGSVSVGEGAAGIVQAVPERLPPFEECQADAFAFVGNTSLAAIGLGEVGGGPDADRVGSVWVTAGPAAADVFPGPNGPAAGRMMCIEWPDGSGMSTTVDDAWQPPGIGAAAGGAETSSDVPFGPIAAGAAALLLVVISYLAFRRDAHATEAS
jgi:hypothetical protein